MPKAVPAAAIDENTVETMITPHTAGVSHDMSIYGMFAQADIVVQLVMLLLLGASCWCWAIAINKFLRIRRIKSQMRQFERQVRESESLEDTFEAIKHEANDPVARAFVAGMYEWNHLKRPDNDQPELPLGGSMQSNDEYAVRQEMKDRVWHAMESVRNKETSLLSQQLGVLATTGSAAPFIGLFGTVWGIMNAFTAIAQSQNSTLAVVAPGIAEALFATAIGLFAAIPAVILYNYFSNQIVHIATHVDEFMDNFSTAIARELDKK